MRENVGKTFLDDLFGFLDGLIDTGAEVHVVDKSDPDNVIEHVFNSDEDEEEIPFTSDEPCDGCPHYSDCHEATDECDLPLCEDYEPDMWGVPDIDRVVFSGPATIVFWADGTKTVVKCMDGEKFERYAGFAAACMKKMFGSTSRAKAIMNELTIEQSASEPKKKKDVYVPDLTEAFNEVIANRESVQEAINETFTKG